MPAHDRLVPQRVADALDEVRLMVRNRERDRAEHCDPRQGDEQAPHDASFASSVMRPATHASRSSKLPVLT